MFYRSCTEDESFYEALEGIEREPVPYFVQLSSSSNNRKPTAESSPPHDFAFLTSREPVIKRLRSVRRHSKAFSVKSPIQDEQRVIPSSAAEDMRSSVSGEMTPEQDGESMREEIRNEDLFRYFQKSFFICLINYDNILDCRKFRSLSRASWRTRCIICSAKPVMKSFR